MRRRLSIRSAGNDRQSGLGQVLGDPMLNVYDANGTLVRANDNWPSEPVQAQALLSAGFAPGSGLEAAVVVTLPPGNYTAIVTGNDGSEGITLFDACRAPGPVVTPLV